MVVTLEDERQGRETQIENSVDETVVDTEEEQHRLDREEVERLEQRTIDDGLGVKLHTLDRRTNSPVAGLMANLLSAGAEGQLRVGLLQAEDHEHGAEGTHDSGDVLRPAPAEIGVRDEGTDDGRNHRTCNQTEDDTRNGLTTLGNCEQISGNGRADDKRGAATGAHEETAKSKSLVIFSSCRGKAKQHEPEHTDHQGQLTAVQFRGRSPEDRAYCESNDIKTDWQGRDDLTDVKLLHELCGTRRNDRRAPGHEGDAD